MKISKVYTRTGDAGETSIVGGHRIGKDSARLQAYGDIDELTSHIGLLAALSPADAGDLQRIARALFTVGTHLAIDQSRDKLFPAAMLPADETTWIESLIDKATAGLPPLSGFVLPGGTVAAAEAHVCRTVCRRAERSLAALAREAEVGSEERRYVNRLSDWLFTLARVINQRAGTEETLWRP